MRILSSVRWQPPGRLLCALAAFAVIPLAGCGSGSSSAVQVPAVSAARIFKLGNFSPVAVARAGQPTRVSFVIRQPSGQALTSYKRGAGPHTGIHLIIVRSDLSSIIHTHPPVAPNGRISQVVTFPAPGRYRVIVDAYPNLPDTQPNFQLFNWITVAGKYTKQKLPPFHPTVAAGGYTFRLVHMPKLKALQPAFINVQVTDRSGHKAVFQPWYGALAHAIFFRSGSLDYFHTHVCGVGAANCTSTLGGSKITGKSTTPGKLTVGVLVPVPGTWRLFLQCQVNGKILTAPFTLKVG
jgi:hypothetical protein